MLKIIKSKIKNYRSIISGIGKRKVAKLLPKIDFTEKKWN